MQELREIFYIFLYFFEENMFYSRKKAIQKHSFLQEKATKSI